MEEKSVSSFAAESKTRPQYSYRNLTQSLDLAHSAKIVYSDTVVDLVPRLAVVITSSHGIGDHTVIRFAKFSAVEIP